MTSRLQTHPRNVAAAAAPNVTPPRTYVSRERYNGAELQPRSPRPGAYAAQAIPSLINGKRLPWRPPSAQAQEPQP